MNDHVKIYDFRGHTKRAAELEASSAGWRKGPPEHGPLGSPEWWAAIDSGKLPVHTREYVIIRSEMVDGIRMGEPPELAYWVRTDGQETWMNDRGYIPELQAGERLRDLYVTDPTAGAVTIELWKAPPLPETSAPALQEPVAVMPSSVAATPSLPPALPTEDSLTAKVVASWHHFTDAFTRSKK